jgi:hypothetical protein
MMEKLIMRDTNELAGRNATLSRRSLTKLAIAMSAVGASTSVLSKGAGAQSADGGGMLLATTTVEDFDRFMSVFAGASLPKRKLHGSSGASVFNDPFDKSRVWVVFEWDEKGWQSFVSDPEVPPILKSAGHTSKATPAKFAGRYGA